jgi:predicted aspartyl protease
MTNAASMFPYLTVHLSIGTLDQIDFECDFEPLVDTGFSGGLAVPADLIPSSVAPDTYPIWRLADGTEVMTPAYTGYITIGNLPPVLTDIIALENAHLLGRAVTNNFRVIFDHGQEVIVES